MVDSLSPKERSERMALIRSKDTWPEIALRRELHRLGMRYRLNSSRLPGKPDIVLSRHRSVIFVHGCFWHRHKGCSIATTPKSNIDMWQAKFDRNVARDKRVVRELQAAGWRVYTAWECDLQSKIRAEKTAERIARYIRSGKPSAKSPRKRH